MRPNTPVAYAAQGEHPSPRWCYAFSPGCGGINVVSQHLYPGPVALFGSVKLWSTVLMQAIAEGRDWYYGDHAYFRRYKYYRITKNRFQHSGVGEPDYDRLRLIDVKFKPWQDGGRHIVICPPDQIFASLMGFDAESWLRDICYELRRFTDRPFVIRKRSEIGAMKPLGQDLFEAWALVTYMSNAAVEAIIEGVPVFCTGDCAGSSMGLRDLSRIESPVYPDWREKWAATLAANQWTMDEMSRGDCWRRIRA